MHGNYDKDSKFGLVWQAKAVKIGSENEAYVYTPSLESTDDLQTFHTFLISKGCHQQDRTKMPLEAIV